MYQRGKKLLSMLLALCMFVSLVPLTAQAALLEGEDYITQQLYLGEDIVLHLRGNIPDAYKNATAVITFCGESKSCSIGDLTQDENGLYDMAVEVDVAEMTENIGLKATYLGLTAIEENYSVAQYLKTLVNGNYTNQTKALALELLNYGTAAQNFFDYKTDNLANADGYEYPPANAVPSAVPTAVQSGSVDGIEFYGTSVRFLSKTAVRFYFAADSVDGLTFTVDGTQYTPNSNENGYFIEVGGINPQDMDNVMTVEVTDGADTLSVEYAPINYFVRTYHNSEDEELKTLAEAAYSYFVAANNFVGVEPTGDFVEGISFDKPGNVQLFSGVGGDNAWRDALLEIVSLEDNNVLKLTCAASQWPVFRINFGKTLEAGTVLAFDAYSTDLSDESRTTVSIFEYVSGGEATEQYYYNSWNRLKITLTSDCDHIDLMCNMDRWNEPGPANLVVYLDNFKAIQPVEPSGDIFIGFDFEEAGHAARFTGIGVEQDADIEITSFADSNVLKLSHSSHYYPTFQMNFGQTLKAGTTITFDVWGTFDGWQSGNDMNIEFTGDSGSGQVVYMVPETWFTATITLTEDRDHLQFFWNIERGNGISGSVASTFYIDNVKASAPIDITEGYDFETANDLNAFDGIGTAQDANMAILPFGDSNVLQLSHNSHYYPTFQMNFGKTLKAGTTITFDVWGTFDGWQSGNDMNIEFTGDSGSGQVVYMVPETWFTATITLTEDRDHLQFFWNIERGNGISGDVASCIRIDNVLAVEPPAEPSGDILAGIDFETEGNELRFTGIGYSQDATVERVTYSDAGVAAGENGGSYAAKLSNNSHYYPTFQMNFGQTLKAGTTITFDVWGTFDGWVSGNDMNIEFTGDSGSGQVVYMVPETWFTATITLTEDRDHLQFFWNIERGNGISGDVASYILIDNVKAVEPDNTFYNGLFFDNSTDVNYFGAVSGQEWRSPALEIVSFDGDNALKITCAASQWPALRINFGRTLPTGTQITFQAYTNDTTGIRNTVSIFEAMANCTETAQYYHGSWTNLVTTLTADCSYIDLCVNFDRWNEITPSNIEVYIDNVIVQQGFTAGADFEMPYDIRFFTGAANGNEWRDATAQIVSKDGSNVLMMTGANSLWPTFKIDFGETLKAGTTISFDVLGVIDYEQEGMSMTFNPIDGNVVTDEYGQAVWMLCDEWNNKTITLSADCSSISFYWDAGRNNLPDGIVSYVYIDNVVVNAA